MIGIFGGSFDPITIGHDYIIGQAAQLCDTLCVIVADNESKTNQMFEKADRVKMCDLATHEYNNVVVSYTEELLVDYANKIGAKVLFRGLRYASEYEYELDLATWNAKIGNIATVGIFPKDLEVSSSAIRLLIKRNKAQWKNYVKPDVADYIENNCLRN